MKKYLTPLFIACTLLLFSFMNSHFTAELMRQGKMLQKIMSYCKKNNCNFFKIQSYSTTDESGNKVEMTGNCQDQTGSLYEDSDEGISFKVHCFKERPVDSDAVEISKYVSAQKPATDYMTGKMKEGEVTFTVPEEYGNKYSGQVGFIIKPSAHLMEKIYNYCLTQDLNFFKFKSFSFEDEHGNSIKMTGKVLDTAGVVVKEEKNKEAFEAVCFKQKPMDQDTYDIAQAKATYKQVADMMNQKDQAPVAAPSEFVQEVASLEELNKAISSQKGFVFVDFYGEYCGPCKQISPLFNKWAEEFAAQGKFLKMNVNKVDGLLEEYDIQSIPTLIIFEGGEQKDKKIGLYEVSDFINKDHPLKK